MKSFEQFLFEQSLSPQEALSILGLSADDLGDDAKLKKAYRSASMKAHPDRGGNVEQMQKVNASYELLKNTSGSSLSGMSRKDAEDKAKRQHDEAANMAEQYFSRLNVSKYKNHLESVIGVGLESNVDSKVSGSGISMYVQKMEFATPDRDIVVDIRMTYNLVNYVKHRGSLGDNNDTLPGEVGVTVEIAYKGKKIKLTRGNFNLEKYGDLMTDPETILPKTKFKRQIKKVESEMTDSTTKWIKKADFQTTLKQKFRDGDVFAGSGGLTFQIRFGDGYIIQANRATMMRKGVWSLDLFKKMKRATDQFMPSIPETNTGLDAFIDAVEKITRSSNPEKTYTDLVRQYKQEDFRLSLFPES